MAVHTRKQLGSGSAADQEISVELLSTKTADPELALKQIARIISIDYDGNEFLRGAQLPVITQAGETAGTT